MRWVTNSNWTLEISVAKRALSTRLHRDWSHVDMLYCGDCLEVMPSLPSQSVDLVLCDLPYGVTARNEWDAVIPFVPLWAEYNRLTRGAVVLTATQPFAAALLMSNAAAFKYEWIWHKTKKTGFLNARRQPLRNHEQVLVFYQAQPTYMPQGVSMCDIACDRGSADGVGTNYRQANPKYTQTQTGYPATVLSIASEGKTAHPTQKPVALMEYLIRTYTNPGDTVLDNCMGSGTTGVACVNTNRQFIGIERDHECFKIAQNRILQAALAKVRECPLR